MHEGRALHTTVWELHSRYPALSLSVGAFPEVRRELLDGVDVGSYGILGVITTLELIQHQLSKMGHKDLFVTHTLTP
jgi:hypothetical protein